MGRTLNFSAELFTLRTRIKVCDQAENLVYEVCGMSAFFCHTWKVLFQGEPFAVLQRLWLSWRTTMEIATEERSFQIVRRHFAWTPHYDVVGGPFNGAEIVSNFWQWTFNVTYQGQILAVSRRKWFSFRKQQDIEILADTPEAERFVVIAAVAMQLIRMQTPNHAF